MKTRTGKIARLPRLIRNELNQRLDDGEEGKKLVRWLNRLPEVREVMAESFGGKPVTEQNLSDWRAGGFAEWVLRQEFLEQARELAEDAEELRAVSGKGQFSFSEHLSTVLAMRYAKVFKEWQGEASEGMTKQLRLLHGLSHDVARLARVGLERQKVELTREKSQAELVELFSEWMEIPAVREAYEVQGPRSKGQSLGGRKSKGTREACGGSKRNGGTRGAFRDTRGGCGPRAGETGAFTSEPLRTRAGRKRWLKDPTRCDALGRELPEVKAAAQKQLAEDLSRYYIPKRPGCEEEGAGRNNGVRGANPGQSNPIVPPAMEAEVARLNRGDENGQGNVSQGNYGNHGTNSEPEWDEEDEKLAKHAEESWRRREAARKEAEQQRINEENRIWRVQCHFEEPTAEDIALGRVKVSKVQSP